MNKITNKIAFLIISCDKYSDLWKGFDESINKFWPDCPFDIYLISNYKSFESEKIKSLQVGEDINWSLGLKKALDVIKERYKYSIITLEDLFLVDKVDNDVLLNTLDKAIKNEVKYLRLHRNKFSKSKSNQPYELLSNKELYRFNCTYSLWDNNFLYSLLRDDENAWQFEYNSPKRAMHEENVYMVSSPIFTYSNTVIKGMWVPSEANLIRDLFPDYKINRRIMSREEAYKIKRGESRFRFVINYFPKFISRCLITAKRKLQNKK